MLLLLSEAAPRQDGTIALSALVQVRCLGQLQLEGGTGVELYPAEMRSEIDAWNDK